MWAVQLLDRVYGLKDRLSNALEFVALPSEQRTPMMLAALEDAEHHAQSTAFSPMKAYVFQWPLYIFIIMTVAISGLIKSLVPQVRAAT